MNDKTGENQVKILNKKKNQCVTKLFILTVKGAILTRHCIPLSYNTR